MVEFTDLSGYIQFLLVIIWARIVKWLLKLAIDLYDFLTVWLSKGRKDK